MLAKNHTCLTHKQAQSQESLSVTQNHNLHVYIYIFPTHHTSFRTAVVQVHANIHSLPRYPLFFFNFLHKKFYSYFIVVLFYAHSTISRFDYANF